MNRVAPNNGNNRSNEGGSYDKKIHYSCGASSAAAMNSFGKSSGVDNHHHHHHHYRGNNEIDAFAAAKKPQRVVSRSLDIRSNPNPNHSKSSARYIENNNCSLSPILPIREAMDQATLRDSLLPERPKSRSGRDCFGEETYLCTNSENFYRYNPASQPPQRITKSDYYCYGEQQQQSPREEEGRNSNYPTNSYLKKPPPNYASHSHVEKYNPNNNNAKHKKNLPLEPPNSLQFDRKPPPPSSPLLPKSNQVRSNIAAKTTQHQPTKLSSVPKVVDLSNLCGDETGLPPPPPPLSPISFSSSMFVNKKTHNFYPSKESIERQLGSLPPMEPFFPVDPSMNNNNHSKTAAASNHNTKAGPNSSDVANPARNDGRTRTAQPSSEESTTTTSTNLFKSRPEKPLRINSQFPSQLQLQKQKQQQQSSNLEQHVRNQLREYNFLDTIPSPQPPPKGVTNGIATHIETPPLGDDYPSPQPLPKGNGVTNGIATRIDAQPQQSSTFVPQRHNQEYDLQLSSPPSTPPLATETTNRQPKLQPQSSQTKNPAPPPSTTPVVKVEIYPGVSMVLRGAQETSLASKRNFVVNCTCLVCSLEFCCIADAAFCICPGCLVVNPLDDGTIVSMAPHKWGVGLGYVPEKDGK